MTMKRTWKIVAMGLTFWKRSLCKNKILEIYCARASVTLSFKKIPHTLSGRCVGDGFKVASRPSMSISEFQEYISKLLNYLSG